MNENDLKRIENLMSRKRNYEQCIACLTPSNGPVVVTNPQSKHTEFINGRRFAMISRHETNSSGILDEKAEALLLPVFKQLLDEVQKEIDAVSIGGMPGKESDVKSFYTEVVSPDINRFKKDSKNPSEWTKWIIAILIGIGLIIALSL